MPEPHDRSCRSCCSPEPGRNIVEAASADEVASRSMDGVFRVGDVASLAHLFPRGREELHRALCPGRAEPVDTAHPGLDEVDARKDLPVDSGLC